LGGIQSTQRVCKERKEKKQGEILLMNLTLL
jgi:hypothetical protein